MEMSGLESKDSRIEALNAYLSVLDKNGAGRAGHSKAKHVALYLLSKLKDRELTSEAYRETVDAMLKDIGGGMEHFCLTVAREFYVFARNDIKAIARIMATGGCSGRSAPAAPIECVNIDELIATVNAQPFDARERAIHRRYVGQLKRVGADAVVLETRGNLAKVLLAMMKGLAVSGDSYRVTIDRLFPLFTKNETRLYFLAVAREFYYFLIEDPDASRMIVVAKFTSGGIPRGSDDVICRGGGGPATE